MLSIRPKPPSIVAIQRLDSLPTVTLKALNSRPLSLVLYPNLIIFLFLFLFLP